MTPRSAGRGRSVTLIALAFGALLALVPATVQAHAELDTVTPADGATVEVAPAEIVMTFTQDLDPSRSSIVVVDSTGAEVASGGEVGADPRTMTLALPTLDPGAYEVRWTSYSAEDDELERGITTFTIMPPPPTSTPTAPPPSATPAPPPSATPAPSATPTPLPSPTGSGTPTSGTADILIPIVAAVVLVAGLGYWLARRRTGAGGTP
jgi:methionine-rich copper-binding protein CopC